MAEVSSLQQKILQAAGEYLTSLKRDEEGRIILAGFPENFLPVGTNLDVVKNFLFNIAQTTSLQELFERKEEIIGLLGRIGQEPLPRTTVVTPKEELIIRPEGEEKGEKRIKITGFEEIQEIITNLTHLVQQARLKQAPIKKTPREKEKVVYEKEPPSPIAADTEREIRETLEAIEKNLKQKLEEAIPKYPQLKKLKKKEEISEVAHRAAQAIQDNLVRITDTKEAISFAQDSLQQEADLPRDPAYELTKGAILDIAPLSNRARALEYIRHNQAHEQATDAFESALREAGLSSLQADKAINRLDLTIDPLLTKDFSRKETDVAAEILKAALRPAFSKDGLSGKNAELAAEALTSPKVTRVVQNLAERTDSWDAVPPSLRKLAFETTVPKETTRIASEIKSFVVQFGLGRAPSRREEVEAEKLATEMTKRLIKKRREIMARARQRGLRAQISTEQALGEETPQIIKTIALETLSPEFSRSFAERLEKTLKETEFSPSLLESAREVLATPSPQLTPREKEKAIAIINQFITQEILLGKIAPRDETAIGEIAQTTVEEILKEVQASPFLIERPEQIREITLKSLRLALEQHQEKYPSLVQRTEKGVMAAMAAEELPPSLLRNLQETIQALPPKLLPWQEKEIAKLVRQGALSPEAAVAYRKIIAQRKETEAFLSPITPPGVVSRISEKALASHLLSTKKTKEERKQLSERARFLLEQAEEIASKNRISRSLLDRLFRLLTGEKDSSQTLESLAKLGPEGIKFPTQFRQEIFRRFFNSLFQKSKWKRMDKSTGESHSRFGREALKKAFSRLFSPIKKRLTQGIRTALRTAGRLLGKIIKPALSFLFNSLIIPAFQAIAGFLSTLIPALLGFFVQAAGWLAATLGGLVSTVGVPIVIIIVILLLIISLFAFILGIQHQSAFVDYPQTAGDGSCDLYDPVLKTPTLKSTFQEAGRAFKIPPGVVAGVANIEGNHLWDYTDPEIVTFSQERAQDPINCNPNACGARGPMQFLAGKRSLNPDECPQTCLGVNKDGECIGGLDVWSGYKDAVNEGRDPHVCNIKDSIFAGAKMLKEKSQTAPENNCVWNKDQVYNAARGYYGKCEYAVEVNGEIITGDYCKRVWQYYINVSAEPIIYP